VDNSVFSEQSQCKFQECRLLPWYKEGPSGCYKGPPKVEGFMLSIAFAGPRFKFDCLPRTVDQGSALHWVTR
jgi:hypothetical protein